jgi:hypothetical protein
MSRDALAADMIGHIKAFSPDEFPKPKAAFETWSKGIENAVFCAVRSVVKESNGVISKWQFDTQLQKFAFSYDRYMELNGSKLTLCKTFWLDATNQKLEQREGPLWDEIWTVVEEVRLHDVELTKFAEKFKT